MSGPVVGVTAWRRSLDTFLGVERLHTLSDYYAAAVIEAGMLPLIFPAGQDPERAERLVSMVSGLVLSGGDDLDPATYGETPTDSKSYSGDVDRFEVALVRAARDQEKPVLAICRGVQLLNAAFGGTLAQEITVSGGVHEPIGADTDPDELNRRRHVVRFAPDSLLAEVYDAAEIKTNTLHHQGLADIAPDLLIEGTTDDGLVEAVRCDGSWWAIGVQWHPERMESDHHGRLFSAFRDAIAAMQ